jgi:hypothetical protein
MFIWNKLGKPLTKTDAPITPEIHSKKKPASAKKIAVNKAKRQEITWPDRYIKNEIQRDQTRIAGSWRVHA